MGQKILVVEDNELNLKLFCDLLRAHGYAAEPVRDGREAIERARAFVPDLVVMDIQMPHISGLELIEQMKADAGLRQIPIMAVTAYAAKGDEERIRDAGAEGYVSKPISVMKFVAAVAALLESVAARNDEPVAGPDDLPPADEEAISATQAPTGDETAEPEAVGDEAAENADRASGAAEVTGGSSEATEDADGAGDAQGPLLPQAKHPEGGPPPLH